MIERLRKRPKLIVMDTNAQRLEFCRQTMGVQHTVLGLGVVQGSAGLGKVKILFDSREAVLVHDRR